MATKRRSTPKSTSPAPSLTVITEENLPQVLEELEKLPKEQQDAVWNEFYWASLRSIAMSGDTPQAFAAFYEMVHGNQIPTHNLRQIQHIYDSKTEDKGCLIFSWRGSWKTTTISVTFTVWRIGQEPQRANLVVQANDAKAAQTTKQITDIVEQSKAFHEVFPHVVPDKERGWSAEGYEVKRDDIPYPEWRKQNTARKDPTLVGYGIGSKSLIGSHPDGILLLDDVHDEVNSSSARERRSIVTKVSETILPFIVQDAKSKPGQRMKTWFIAVGTPWADDDAYHYLKNTGEFKFLSIPVMTRASGEETNIVHIGPEDMTFGDHTEIFGDWVLTWPEMFDVPLIVTWRNRAARRGFARMYLLDLSVSKETGIAFTLFPSDKIDMNYPISAGVDYASTIELRAQNAELRGRSKFAIAYGAELPIGRAVIFGGFSDYISQLRAEEHTKKVQGLYLNFRTTGVEMNGKGEEFYSLMSRNPEIRLMPFWTGKDSKHNRQERQLAPYLEMGLLMISDEDTPFLNTLRKALDDWPYGDMDEIDAVLAYSKTIPHILRVPQGEDEQRPGSIYNRPRKQNVLAAFGRH